MDYLRAASFQRVKKQDSIGAVMPLSHQPSILCPLPSLASGVRGVGLTSPLAMSLGIPLIRNHGRFSSITLLLMIRTQRFFYKSLFTLTSMRCFLLDFLSLFYSLAFPPLDNGESVDVLWLYI